MTTLRTKTVKGVAVLGAGAGLGRIISFVNTIVLAHILSPDDYGLMAMAMVVCGFIGFFNEIGLGSAIIQRKNLTENQLNGAFTLTIIASLVLYALTCFFAPVIGDFYQNTQIADMLTVLACTFVFGAFSTVSSALISKKLQFGALAGIEFLAILVQVVITLVFALMGYKAWSLVFGFVVSQFVRSVLVIVLARWRPTRFGDISAAIELIKFGLTVTYSRLTWYAYSHAATFIIGKFSGEKQLGIYSMATTLADLPTSHLTSLVQQVASPVFATLQDDLVALNKMLNGFTAGLALLTFPILAGMAITASELIPLLLGEQWLLAIFPMQALALTGAMKSVSPLLTQAFTSIGKANITARYTTLCAVIVPLSAFIGVLWQGINGVAILLSCSYFVLLIILLLLCRHYFQLSILAYIKQLITTISGCIAMIIGVYLVKLSLFNHLDMLALFVIEVLVGVAIYLLWLIYIRPDGLAQLKQVLVEMGVGENKLARWPFNRVREQ